MQRLFLHCLFSLGLAASASGQERTLDDISRELSDLFIELQTLTRDLSTAGGFTAGIGDDTLQRLDLIEAELQRLTLTTEQMQFLIANVVRDGTNRIGDLEFRLCELEAHCDIASLGETPMLGGEVAAATAASASAAAGAQFAVGEQSDFDEAMALLDEGSYRDAAERFMTFAETYTSGPLTSEAHFMRGEALTELGDTSEAARAYLESFSGSPEGERAPDALLRLGVSLAALGQVDEACRALSEVAARFPGSAQTDSADVERQRLDCS